MPHANYFEIRADSFYDLGLRVGRQFGHAMRQFVAAEKRRNQDVTPYRSTVETTTRTFPHLVEETRGYADGAGVTFEDVWIGLEDDELETERCTTIVTNAGLLVAHNEDWDVSSSDAICVLRKTVRDLTIFELFYLNTLGGNAISINSHGFVHAVNSLNHRDRQIGIPENVVSRWLSETRCPESDARKLQTIERASGYSHTLVRQDGKTWNIECTSKEHRLTTPSPPFVHTNHFLTGLESLGDGENMLGTFERYACATSKTRAALSADEAKELMSDTSEGPTRSLFNASTIARMIVDLETTEAHVWLRREQEKGWVTYGLDFLGTA